MLLRIRAAPTVLPAPVGAPRPDPGPDDAGWVAPQRAPSAAQITEIAMPNHRGTTGTLSDSTSREALQAADPSRTLWAWLRRVVRRGQVGDRQSRRTLRTTRRRASSIGRGSR